MTVVLVHIELDAVKFKQEGAVQADDRAKQIDLLGIVKVILSEQSCRCGVIEGVCRCICLHNFDALDLV